MCAWTDCFLLFYGFCCYCLCCWRPFVLLRHCAKRPSPSFPRARCPLRISAPSWKTPTQGRRQLIISGGQMISLQLVVLPNNEKYWRFQNVFENFERPLPGYSNWLRVCFPHKTPRLHHHISHDFWSGWVWRKWNFGFYLTQKYELLQRNQLFSWMQLGYGNPGRVSF